MIIHESQRVHRDGHVIDVGVTVSPVHNRDGVLVGYSSVARDISERKRTQAERERLGERLRQSERLESLGQLAGGIAHDFNNLLGAILNYATFVAEATADNPAVHADVEQIQAAAQRAARLTRQLLIIGRREPIRPETLDLNAIVVDIRELLARTIGEHVVLDVRLAPKLPNITADRGQTEQVLLNLAVNARDAMPDGGTLTIGTGLVDLDDDYIGLHPGANPGPHVELTVSDTGVGIPADVRAHVFEPFFTTKPKGQGTGLGLATVYSIVTEAGGSIGIYSESGIGTTLRVLLPVSDKEAHPLTASLTPAPASGRDRTVLVVEDEPAILETTARILRRGGYTVLEATSGDDALAMADTYRFDLLLTDSVMPHMSGTELAEHLAAAQPGVPVLFMSGYSEGVIGPRRVIREGAPLIEKPFTAEVLIRRVGEVIDAERA